MGNFEIPPKKSGGTNFSPQRGWGWEFMYWMTCIGLVAWIVSEYL
jgi:hypothetical protein